MGINIDNFIKDISDIKQRYTDTQKLSVLQKDLYTFSKKYCKVYAVSDYLLNIGEEHIANGDYEAGISYIKAVDKHFKYVGNETTLYLRMAEHYIENEDISKGSKYLVKLCTDTVDNYEESIAFNELTHVWNKYKHLVIGKVPKSISINSSATPLPPEECTASINDIFSLEQDNILSELFSHLMELCGNGEYMNNLNQWESVVFYTLELCTEVNSGGFDSYLYYYVNHFQKAIDALKAIDAQTMISLTEDIVNKFPCKKLPKSTDSIQNALDTMGERGIDFETEDDIFYETGEKELLNRLLLYAVENREYFR